MKRFYIVSILLLPLVGMQPLYAQKMPLPKRSAIVKEVTAGLTSQQLLRQIARLEEENARLAAQNAAERAYQAQLFSRLRKATFRAVPTLQGPSNSYTGTVFEVNYQGQKEVFGVIAAHTLQDPFNTPGLLQKNFMVAVTKEEKTAWVPAQVVQVTSPHMMDLALVKFSAKDEALFTPLTLPEAAPTLPAQGYAQGYACNLLGKQTFPILGKTSIGLFKAKLPAVGEGQRAGFCGSPVFSKNFQFVGIHVGSSYKTQTGYIVPASVLQQLVEAYHHPQATPQVITLAGRELARLALDEYVTRIELVDAQQNVLWAQNTKVKFSLTQAEQELKHRAEVAFVRLTIGHSTWQENGKDDYILTDSSPRTLVIPWAATAH